MVKKFRIGVVGLVHDHVWGLLRDFKKMGDVEVSCAADINEPLLAKVKEQFGVGRLYEGYRDLLSREEVDAVLVTTENSRHAEVTEAAAAQGVHVMVEKPMAASLEQAERMVGAARRGGVKLMVNYATAWSPEMRHAVDLASQGRIGRLFQARYRAAHEGPREIGCSRYFYEWLYDRGLNGAGALMDYCCYGANFCRWILGMPERAVALGGTYVRDYLAVEDNAVLLMGYPRAMGIAEASWSQVGDEPHQYTLILNGSEGAVLAKKGSLRLFTSGSKEWRTVEPPVLEEGKRSGPEYFLRCIREDRPVEGQTGPEVNRDAQAILEAGLISMETGRAIPLSELKTGK